MSKFIYSETIPSEVLPAIKDKLAKYEYLIPGWAHEVRVYWNGSPRSDQPISGSSSGDFAYRWARIELCPAFLDETDADREDTAIHELVHVILCPLTNFYAQLLHYLDEQPDNMKNFVDSQFSEKIEGVTVDLTSALVKVLKGEQSEPPKLVSHAIPSKKKRVVTRKKR